MKSLYIMALVCALMSLLAIFGLSAMTVVPGPGTESFRGQMIFAAFFVAWFYLAFWLRKRQRAASQSAMPQWLRRLLIFVGVVYLATVFSLVFG
jgi:hypothetical protein